MADKIACSPPRSIPIGGRATILAMIRKLPHYFLDRNGEFVEVPPPRSLLKALEDLEYQKTLDMSIGQLLNSSLESLKKNKTDLESLLNTLANDLKRTWDQINKDANGIIDAVEKIKMIHSLVHVPPNKQSQFHGT